MKLTPELKKYTPLFLAALFAAIFLIIMASSPKTRRDVEVNIPAINIETLLIKKEAFQITIGSYGRVQALTQTNMVARVSGEVLFVSEDFRQGGFFTKGQLLATLDKSDYVIELDIATAQVAEAKSRLASELAQAEEARHDWKSSGRTGEPPALAVRKPQLDAAEAALKSAQAGVARAELNLSRTDIKAPYDGSVIRSHVALGQVVNSSSTLAEVFATDAAEITLPIKSDELHLLNLDHDQVNTAKKPIAVEIESSLFDKNIWQGRIVRVSSAIEEQSRQLSVVARVNNPFTQNTQRPPLKIGEYTTARISGNTIENAIVIPNHAIYQGQYVYIFQDDQVHRRDIQIEWRGEEESLINKGLDEGDQVVLTALGQISSGTPAQVSIPAPPAKDANTL
ncbi:MAG: efflux RND transporter periplasmic adaptor subunit [Agarilytica sp.]